MFLSDALAIAEALADQSRMLILRSLVTGPAFGEDLARQLQLSPSTVSFHLKKLEAAGLVSKEKRQYYQEYSLHPDLLNLPLRALLEFDHPAPAGQTKRLEQLNDQLIRPFFHGKRLLKLPAPWKKRRLVLGRIARRFSRDRHYTEIEVNALIREAFDDYCLLRRELIDHGFLARNKGHYWVPADPAGNSPAETAAPEKEKVKKMPARSEVKKAFKEAPVPCGIFQIRSLKDGQVFIGKTMNLRAAFNRHPFDLSLGSHQNKALQSAWKKLGAESFVLEILEEIKPHEDGTPITPEELDKREEHWLARQAKAYRSFKLI